MLVTGMLVAAFAAATYSPPPALAWKLIAPGVWRAQVGKKEALTLLSAAESMPAMEALKHLPTVSSPPIALNKASGERVENFAVARIPLEPDEKLFGLGLQMHGSNRRGGVYHLRMDHYSAGKDRLHAPTPLYISSRGYAVLFNTARPCTIYAGVGNRQGDPANPKARDRNTDPKWDPQPPSDAVEASVQAGGLEILLFAGPTPMDALRRYNLLCGGGALPPRWALGFWHRVPLTSTAQQAEDEVAAFAEKGYPLDVLGLEPGWQSSSYPGTFDWSGERFPNPGAFMQKMTADGIHVNLWENPYVSENSKLFEPLRSYFGSHTVWLGAVPDLNVPKAAEILREHHKKVGVDIGVSGYKIDEVDGVDVWLWPDHARFPSGVPGDEMRQVYGVLWQRELDRLYHESGKRTFGLVRGSNGGASRFPFAIYSDTYDHREYITGLTSAGLAGVMWCAEARSASNGEEWVRRMQTAVVSHIAQLNAWSDGTKPWSFPGYEEPVKKAMQFRIEILPYLYTAFAQYHYQGLPVIRAMSIVDGGEETDQYLLGDDLLVAPMFVGAKSRNVRLPKGAWYDYETGAYAGADQTIEVSPALDKIPLFVREGALIPTIAAQNHAGHLSPGTKLIVRHYGATPGKAMLYDDDGETFAYEQGRSAWYDLESPDGRSGRSTQRSAAADLGVTPTYGETIWLHIGDK